MAEKELIKNINRLSFVGDTNPIDYIAYNLFVINFPKIDGEKCYEIAEKFVCDSYKRNNFKE